LILFPNAKINIGLNIISKRDDGYHNLLSLLYPIPFYDILEIIESKTSNPSYSGLHLKTEDEYIQSLYSFLRKKDWVPGLNWHLHKQIPPNSGLGGGSSDLACFANYLRRYDPVNKHWNEIKDYVLDLSTDAYYFLYNKSAMVEGKGDVLIKSSLDLKGKYLLLLFPGLSMSTATAYDQILPKIKKTSSFKPNSSNISDWKNNLINDFEDNFSKIYTPFIPLKTTLYQLGALYVSLTGSGSVLYALFDKRLDNKNISLPRHKWIKL